MKLAPVYVNNSSQNWSVVRFQTPDRRDVADEESGSPISFTPFNNGLEKHEKVSLSGAQKNV